MRIAIIGVGVAVAAVGVILAWRNAGAVERNLRDSADKILVNIVDEVRKDANYTRREVGEAHKLIEKLEKGAVKEAKAEAVKAHMRINDWDRKFNELAAHVHKHGHSSGS